MIHNQRVGKRFCWTAGVLGKKHGEVHNILCTVKNKNESDKTITYKINIIDSVRFVSSSLSSLVNNLETLTNFV